MKVLFDASNDATVTPLFQVEDGICQDSLGIQCAIAMGLPTEFTTRAQEVGIGTHTHKIFQAIHADKPVVLSPDLAATKNPEALRDIMQALFEKPDWMKASSEEIAAFVKKLSSIQENYGSLLTQSLFHKGLPWEGKDRIATKRPVRKYNDQKVGHIRGYKEVC